MAAFFSRRILGRKDPSLLLEAFDLVQVKGDLPATEKPQ